MEIKIAVINGVLCYLSSARHRLTDQAIVTACLSFYNGEKISEAKELLFKLTRERITRRKGEGKFKADLADMLELLRKLDEKDEELPKFLADCFSTMPPSSGFETNAEHIINLTTEISVLKSEIENLKKCELPSADSLTDIKEDIYDIKNILLQQSTLNKPCHPTVSRNIDATPMLFSDVVSGNKPNLRSDKMSLASIFDQIIKSNNVGGTEETTVELPLLSSKSTTKWPSTKRVNNGQGSIKHQTDKEENTSTRQEEDNSGDWQQIKKKKRKEVIRGTRTGNGLFKGVVTNCNLYIGKCDSAVTAEILSNYIEREYNIKVFARDCLNEYEGSKSFKIKL